MNVQKRIKENKVFGGNRETLPFLLWDNNQLNPLGYCGKKFEWGTFPTLNFVKFIKVSSSFSLEKDTG